MLSALGLYVVTPGTLDYVLGSPVFRHVRIARTAQPYDNYYDTSYELSTISSGSGGDSVVHDKYLDIIALGTGPGSVYVDQVTLNNEPVAGVVVDDTALQQDCVLRFIMRGEENSHEIESRVHTAHLTTTAQLEDKLRSGLVSTNLQENEVDKRQFLSLESDLHAKESLIKDLHLQIEGLKQGEWHVVCVYCI